jgi:NAD(P)-dependent dehydrogenase (short-subunit alcohol dehydrogenase family)
MSPTPARSVLITGCSTGIGRCVAEGLQARGYRVFATARRAESVAELNAAGLESLQLDLADSGSIHRAVDEILSRTDGRLYALFNNGGFAVPGAVEDLSRDAMRDQFETLIFGWHELTNRIIPVMRSQAEGRIIQNSSILGFAAMPFRGAYNASKFAIEGLSDTMRLELQGTGIYISLIEPGPIMSKFRENALLAFKKHINVNDSAHRSAYQGMLARLETQGPAVPFTLPPEAVLKCVLHALTARRPRIRYRVTVPTRVFAVLKRILPTRILDQLLLKAGGDAKR